jgi:hypothetical protein
VTARIIVDMSDDAEAEHLAALLNGGVGNTDPAKGPLSITNVTFQIAQDKPAPSWTWQPVKM